MTPDIRSLSMPRSEILDQSQPDRLTFFRMELASHDILTPDRRDKRDTVCCCSGGNRAIGRIDEIGMHEVPVGSVCNTFEQGAGPFCVDLIPAHVRDFESGIESKPSDYARDNAKPLVHSEFFAFREQELKPQTDPKEWLAGLNGRSNDFGQFEFFKICHAIAKCPDAGEHNMAGIVDHPLISRHHRLVSRGLKRLGDAPQVTHPVVDDGNHTTAPSEGCNNTATGFSLPLLRQTRSE